MTRFGRDIYHRLTGTPLVYHTVGIIVKDLLLEGVERLVDFEPSMTRGESRHENIGLGPFDHVLFDTVKDGLQDVVSTQAESSDIEGRIGDQCEQMRRDLDGDRGGVTQSSHSTVNVKATNDHGRNWCQDHSDGEGGIWHNSCDRVRACQMSGWLRRHSNVLPTLS